VGINLDRLSARELVMLAHDWQGLIGRPEQRIPGNINPNTADGSWVNWFVQAGRGFGKTRVGAETVRTWSKTNAYVNLIGATADDARDIMIEGESGILRCCPTWERPRYMPSKRKLIWPNGAISLIFTADEPERLRGKQHSKLWADELGAWQYAEAWTQAELGLRLGSNPQAVITTTPRPTKLIREIVADPNTLVTRGTTYANKANLAPNFYQKIIRKYARTRLGRQEIKAELLDDNPGALFKLADIENHRVIRAPALRRIVVGVDPQASADPETADDTGIIVAGVVDQVGKDGVRVSHGYILADRTMNGTPGQWGAAVAKAAKDSEADRAVAEVNNGGEMVVATIHTADQYLRVRKVTATRGKAMRAEPVVSLYEQGRVHHVGELGKLEDEMTSWDPDDETADSPNRLDALVWALYDLMVEAQNDDGIEGMKRVAERDKARAAARNQRG
jgi:phage terminase large subunit-like protein